MGYIPFTNDYSSLRTPAFVAAEVARVNARTAAVSNLMANGNALMGTLVTDCCSDPAYGGQGFYDPNSPSAAATALTPSAPGSPATPTGAAVPAGVSLWPLTPPDILSGSNGFQLRANGRPWPRPRLPMSNRRQRINAYPNFGGPSVEASPALVPPCPCFSNAAPIPIAVPAIVPAPVPAAAPASPAACPYPACSTGNVCLDLVTGCVVNSQIDPGQQQACAVANYGVFGNRGTFLAAVSQGCKPLPYLGTPMPNPPQADPSMRALMNSKGLGGLGQTDPSNVGGFLAIVAMFGIVVWATKKM
jgi:hypothetical protein